jgi:hypothetical protein
MDRVLSTEDATLPTSGAIAGAQVFAALIYRNAGMYGVVYISNALQQS